MPTYSCQVCRRQLPTKTIRDRHQQRCECAAYDEIRVQQQRDNAIRWMKENACSNCGQVHTDEASQLKCDEAHWQIDQTFAQMSSDRLLELQERNRHV